MENTKRKNTKGLVTRGFFYTEYVVNVVDTTTAQVSQETMTLPANNLNDAQIERKLQTKLPANMKVVNIISRTTKGELRAMPEDEFIKNSVVLRELDETEKHTRNRNSNKEDK